jgi:hypothetical protein
LRRTTGGRDVVHLETRDAGALLRFADLYRHSFGGWMWMTMAPPSADPAPLEGTLNVRNFVIRDEPALQRLGTPASSPGANANGTASGIEFSHLGIGFTRTPERLILRDGVVRGSSLVATIDGAIDYAGNDMRLWGAFVPLSGLNTTFGQLPVIGLLQGGGNNQGVPAVTRPPVRRSRRSCESIRFPWWLPACCERCSRPAERPAHDQQHGRDQCQ